MNEQRAAVTLAGGRISRALPGSLRPAGASVLTGGINAAAASVGSGGGATVVVGTATEASTLAQQAARDLDIPPTITTAPGASVRIFVARDLDFTRVGPA